MKLEMLKNPWVIGGGALIGVLLLMSRNSGGGSSDPYVASIGESNRLGMQLVAQTSAISADLAKTRVEYSAKAQANLFDMIKNNNQVSAMRQIQLSQINAGIINSQLQTFAAMSMDRTMNATRRELANLDAKVSLEQIAANVKIAKIGAKASTENMITQTLGNVAALGIKSAFNAAAMMA